MRRWCLILLLLVACDDASDAPGAQGERPVEVGGLVYQPPEGVILDIPRLLGKELSAVEHTALGEQLGILKEEVQLPGTRGLERRYEGGVIRIARGRIYYISHTFKIPVDRVASLQQVGLPGNLSPLRPRSLQYRIDRPGNGIRRIALQRAELRSEMVTRVEVWSWLPTEAP